MNPLLTVIPSGRLRIWDHPRDGCEYVIGADMAEGRVRDRSANMRRKLFSYSNEQPDYTAACVIERTSALHVASWHGKVQPDQFVTALFALGLYYHGALIVPEVNGPGVVLVDGLMRLGYPALYRSRVFNYVDQDPLRDEMGWRTTNINRPLLISRVAEALTIHGITRDAKLVDEMRTMEIDANGVARARGHNKDDRVMAFALALQGRSESLTSTGTGERVSANLAHLPVDDRSLYRLIEKKKHDRDYLRPGSGRRLARRL